MHKKLYKSHIKENVKNERVINDLFAKKTTETQV